MSDGMSEVFGAARRKELAKKQQRYVVYYVLETTPRIKKFPTLAKAKAFAKKIDSKDGRQDSWVDLILKGEIIWQDPLLR